MPIYRGCPHYCRYKEPPPPPGFSKKPHPPPCVVVDVTSPVNTPLECTITELIQTSNSVKTVCALQRAKKPTISFGMTTKWTNRHLNTTEVLSNCRYLRKVVRPQRGYPPPPFRCGQS